MYIILYSQKHIFFAHYYKSDHILTLQKHNLIFSCAILYMAFVTSDLLFRIIDILFRLLVKIMHETMHFKMKHYIL